jgi:hypothetical protein
MRDFLGSSNDAYLIQRPDLWAQSAMNTQNLSINDSGQREKVEHLATCFPYRRIAVLLLAFFVEAVDLGDLPRFVVSAH